MRNAILQPEHNINTMPIQKECTTRVAFCHQHYSTYVRQTNTTRTSKTLKYYAEAINITTTHSENKSSYLLYDIPTYRFIY